MAALVEARDLAKHFVSARSLGDVLRARRPLVRAVDGVDLKDRAHAETIGRWSTWTAADDAREASPKRDQLEVLARAVES